MPGTGPDGLAQWGLTGKEPRDTAGFIQAGYPLFDNAIGSGLLADFGYDEDHLKAGRVKIEAFDQANQAQEMAKGASQQAAQDQEAALAKLNDWVAQYLKIAKVALRGKKQLLEKIGVTARAASRARPSGGDTGGKEGVTSEVCLFCSTSCLGMA